MLAANGLPTHEERRKTNRHRHLAGLHCCATERESAVTLPLLHVNECDGVAASCCDKFVYSTSFNEKACRSGLKQVFCALKRQLSNIRLLSQVTVQCKTASARYGVLLREVSQIPTAVDDVQRYSVAAVVSIFKPIFKQTSSLIAFIYEMRLNFNK